MTEITRASVLAQIKALNEAAQSTSAQESSASTGSTGFASTLAESINEISSMQQDANAKAVAFQSGDENANLIDVMLASQKASLSFHAATEVRNKLVNAYQEIMNMPV